jgi:hypothetical protein
MQMVNIFNKIKIPNYSFFNFSINITLILFDFLYDNLYIEDTLTWNLRNALTTNANGEYI